MLRGAKQCARAAPLRPVVGRACDLAAVITAATTLDPMAAQFPLVDIPLFPLKTVLYPGTQLQLRIFETRYLDMVRDCARSNRGFGVCSILAGEEAGDPATPAAIGTIATINDFDSTAEGLLGIAARGGARFEVQRTRVQADGLLRGDVAVWPDEADIEVPVELALLQSIAARLIETMGSDWRHALPSAYEDASWLGFRLAELLPLTLIEHQRMLEITDPLQRLAELRDILPRFQRA